MYSKEEMQQFKREFWTSFGNYSSRKWLLYNTGIKDFSFKFYADNKKIEVLLAIEHKDLELRNIYFQKIESLKTLLTEDYLPEVQFEKNHVLENGKVIDKIWVDMHGISYHNKKNWETIFEYFEEKMTKFEMFFYEFEDYIKDLEVNT